MSSDPPTPASTRRADERVDAICDRFESLWQAGQPLRLEEYLAEAAGNPSTKRELLRQLLLAEWDLKCAQGSSIDTSQYVNRFREDAGLIREVFTEWQAERAPADRPRLEAADDQPDRKVAGHSSGPNIRCPHCDALVRLDGDGSFSDVVCGACRGHFRLTGDSARDRGGGRVAHFELREQLGVGAFGVVWEALDTKLDRAVAVKIPRRLELSDDDVEKFLREARAAAQLRHPNILSVHEVGRDGDIVYIVSELVRGESLGDRLQRPNMSAREAAQLCAKIADALQHAHEKGVIHRDLKPSNIMLDPDGEPHLMDFGLARREAGEVTMTMDGHVLGTPAYMSPEQADGKAHQADSRADIYSLGVLLFESLTGEPPFRGNVRMILHRVRCEEAPSPRKFSSRIPKDLETICLKCLEKDPDRRFASAQILADELRRFVDGTPILTRPISRLSRACRWSQRNQGMAAALASIVALLILGTVVSTVVAVRSRAEKQLVVYSEYVRSIQAASFHTENKSTILARSTLQSTPPEHRNWEWIVLANKAWRQQSPSKQPTVQENKTVESTEFWKSGVTEYIREIIPRRRSGGIKEGRFTVDGTGVILALADGSLGLFSVTTGHQLAEFRRPDSVLNYAAPSPDGKMVLTCALTGGAFVFDLATQKVIAAQPEDQTMATSWDWTWSPTQEYVVSAHWTPVVRVWDAATLKPVKVLSGHTAEVRDLHFSDSEDSLWSASIDGTLREWSFPDGQLMSVHNAPVKDRMNFHAISPDGKTAVATFEDGSSFLWQIETGNLLVALGKPNPDANVPNRRRAAAFSPDGSCVAVMSSLLAVTIYDVKTGVRINQIEGHGSSLRSLRFSPDGTLIMTPSEDGTTRIWTSRPHPNDARTFSNAHTDVIFQIDLDPSRQRLLTGSFDSTARVWDLKSRTLIASYEEHRAAVVSVDFNRNGTSAASLDANGHLHVWKVNTASQLFQIDPESPQFAEHVNNSGGGSRGEILSFPAVLSTGLFSPDGLHVVAYQKDAMKVFDAEDGSLEVPLEGASAHGWPVYSYDSTRVAVLENYGKRARVWDLRTGKLVTGLDGHKRAIVMASFSPVDHRIVTGAMDAKIIIWDSRTGEALQELEDDSGYIMSCRFSSDGQFVLTGYSDNQCRIWDSHSGKLISTLVGHSGRIRDVRISPDKTRLLSWGLDDQAIIWDFPRRDANPLVMLRGQSRLLQAHWSPDGRNIITAWADGSVGIWSGATQNDLSSFLGQRGDSEEQFEETLEEWRKSTLRSLAY